jgi:hypothetical protein
MNYHKDTGYLLEPEELTSASKAHLNAFETAYGLRVNDEERGEPLLMQRFRKRATTRPETIEIQVEENGQRVTYSAPHRLAPTQRPDLKRRTPEPEPDPAQFPRLPDWAEVYRSEIETRWNLTTAETAVQTAHSLFEKFGEFLRQRDWFGAEATLIYLKLGATGRITPLNSARERGRSKHKKKNRKDSFTWTQELQHLFGTYAQRARATPEYRHQRDLRQTDMPDSQIN